MRITTLVNPSTNQVCLILTTDDNRVIKIEMAKEAAKELEQGVREALEELRD